MKKIFRMLLCMLMVAPCFPLTSSTNVDTVQHTSNTGKWDELHTIYIHINRIWVYDCSDKRGDEPGEFVFYIIAFPGFQYSKSPIYDLDDNQPQTSYNLGLIGSIPTQYTPQYIIIQAIEEDNRADFDFNDPLSRIIIKFDPPDGEYTPNHPYSEPVIRWIGRPYFEADISISFYHR